VYVARLPDGVDPGASTLEQAHEAYQKASKYSGDGTQYLGDLVAMSRKKLAKKYQ